MPLFQTFQQMLSAEPHRLAADAFLLTFRQAPIVNRNNLNVVLRSFCAEKGTTFLGLTVSEVLPVEVCEARSILIWQRAMAASTRVRGGDVATEQLILLDQRLMGMNPVQLAQHFKLTH